MTGFTAASLFTLAFLVMLAGVLAAPVDMPQPFILPATYKAGDTVAITIKPDGSFRTETSVRCIMAPCPEAGGQGRWRWDPQTAQLTLREEIAPAWTVRQTWYLGTMTEDLHNSFIFGAKVVNASGKRSCEFPVPSNAATWRRDRSKDGSIDEQ